MISTANRRGQLGRMSCVTEGKDVLRFGDVLRFPLKNKKSSFTSGEVFIVHVRCVRLPDAG